MSDSVPHQPRIDQERTRPQYGSLANARYRCERLRAGIDEVVGQRPDVVPAQIGDQLRVLRDGGVVVVDQAVAGHVPVLVEPAGRRRDRLGLIESRLADDVGLAMGDRPGVGVHLAGGRASRRPRRSCGRGPPRSSRPDRPRASTPSTTPRCSCAAHRTRRCSCRRNRSWRRWPQTPTAPAARHLTNAASPPVPTPPCQSAQNGLWSPFISMNSRKITGTPRAFRPTAVCCQ